MLQKLQKISFKKLPTWFWICLPSLLFYLAWEPNGITPILFVAFMPMIILANRFALEKRYKYYGSIFLALLGWNITTTWWVYYASDVGAIFMLMLNALFMCVPFIFYRIALKRNFGKWAFVVFAIAWILYEYGHHRWDLSWPWLCLGNGFSGWTGFIQWYEWTGTLGGTALVLWMNYLFFEGYSSLVNNQNTVFNVGGFSGKYRKFYWILIVFCALYGLSFCLKSSVNITEGKKINVVALQPSYDPWNEKFNRPSLQMEEEMIKLSASYIDSSTDWLLWPETSLVDNINLNLPERDGQVEMLNGLYRRLKWGSELGIVFGSDKSKYRWNSKLQILTGASTIRYFNSVEKPTSVARKSQYDKNLWYEVFNDAMYLDSSMLPKFYHKSKLVPGTEQMPFLHYLPFLEELALGLDENSATGSLGKNDSAEVFGRGEVKVAPVICYESIYGDYIREYINKGAGWIGIVTNDAWWRETAGYQQHFSFAKLRAIEMRKWIARSANTGTSAFIDPLGNSYQNTEWFDKVCIKQSIYSNQRKTIYAAIGDIGVMAILFLGMILGTYFKRSN